MMPALAEKSTNFKIRIYSRDGFIFYISRLLISTVQATLHDYQRVGDNV